MKSAILYGSCTKLTNAHKAVHNGSKSNPPNGAKPQPEYYVRMKVLNVDYNRALDVADTHMLHGETVLNTVDLCSKP